MEQKLTEANRKFNSDDHTGAAALYQQICHHVPLSDVPKETLIAASRTLGYQLSNGVGVKKNLRCAVDAYRIGAALDDPTATCNLAGLWFDGVPSLVNSRVRKDHIRGANLLGRLLSRVGYVPAMVELGRCYFTGEGVAFDPARATELWSRAEKLAISGKSGQSKEDLVPAVAEAQRALKEVRQLGKIPAKFSEYQEMMLEANATRKGRYGPYTSPWGASGYVQFLRTKKIDVPTVSSKIQFDRLQDGTYLRQPPIQELVALSAELYHLASSKPQPPTASGIVEHSVTAALRMFDEWETQDILYRFVCGARPDVYIDGNNGGKGWTCLHAACSTGRLAMVNRLLSKGVDAMRTASDRKTTPWDLASNFPKIQSLLPHVVDPNEGKSQKKMKNKNKSKGGEEEWKLGDDVKGKPSAVNDTGDESNSQKDVDDWGTGDVLADGLRRGIAKQENDVLADPLFYDPAFYLRERIKKEEDTMQVIGAGNSLHDKSSYENEVLQQIAGYEEAEKEMQKKADDATMKDQEGDNRDTDALLEASLIIGFETLDEDNPDNVYGKAPRDALVALLSHRAPGRHRALRERMMSTTKTNDGATVPIPVKKEDIRKALMDVGAYWSTAAKPAGTNQRIASEAEREAGNNAFKQKRWSKAIEHYTLALQYFSGGSTDVYAEDRDYVGRILSNRSAARCGAGEYHLAAYDAYEIVLDLLPAWPKSYLRLGRACESMGGYDDAKTWYECGAKCAGMLKEEKQKKELIKHAKRCAKTLLQKRPELPTSLPELNAILAEGVKNEDIADSLGLDSPLLYVPVHNEGRLDRTHNVDVQYMKEITSKMSVDVKKVPRDNGVGGDRGLYVYLFFAVSYCWLRFLTLCVVVATYVDIQLTKNKLCFLLSISFSLN